MSAQSDSTVFSETRSDFSSNIRAYALWEVWKIQIFICGVGRNNHDKMRGDCRIIICAKWLIADLIRPKS